MQTCLHSRTFCRYLFSFVFNQSWRARDRRPSLWSVPKRRSHPQRHCSRAEPPSLLDFSSFPSVQLRGHFEPPASSVHAHRRRRRARGTPTVVCAFRR
ncbi:hypothetical protein D4764_07G0011100 [Takifugu flavidus]|uniref:Uncharacterized protein n=1 Tax=Takifugu flavidus TaxID=433684 RepID=A0A5C6MW97_9TELE|nr:hypothetical protein D4764_07G0011100 [Takifugu flavidus]